MKTTLKYPLDWPFGYSRTTKADITWSRFDQTMDKEQQALKIEINRLKADDLIISTNIRVYKNSENFYAQDLNKSLEDNGVAIYFKYKGKDIAMCCDKYNKIWENMYALAKGIEALRGMERWGVSDFIEKAFTGFQAIAEKSEMFSRSIWEILGLNEKPESTVIIHQCYKKMTKECHPDMPNGSSEKWHELQNAYNSALSHFNTINK